VVLSCSLLANLLGWSSAFRDPPHDVNAALNQGYVTLVRNTVFTLLFAVPFTGWVAMTYLFRVCGPLYGIRRYLRRIQDGDWSGECRIRAQDELQDLNDDVNGAVETLLAHLRIEHDLLREAREALAADAPAALREQLDEEVSVLARKLGESRTKPTTLVSA
jgi:biopolymer transport protein ExbB/TolQ